jgi:ankyrin repeat protein
MQYICPLQQVQTGGFSKTDVLSVVLFQNGDSGFHAAALFGHVPVVKQLISAGADLTLRNQDGVTPLQLAQEAKQTAVVEYLSRLVKGKQHQWI